MSYRSSVTFDATSPNKLAKFWALAVGYELQPPPKGFESWNAWAEAKDIPPQDRDQYKAIVDPSGNDRMLFIRVPETKQAKNRVHLDIHVTEDAVDKDKLRLRNAHVAMLIEAGGTQIDRREENGVEWVVMEDPEGNVFCVA